MTSQAIVTQESTLSFLLILAGYSPEYFTPLPAGLTPIAPRYNGAAHCSRRETTQKEARKRSQKNVSHRPFTFRWGAVLNMRGLHRQ
jgi:hypothetical protein